MSDITLSEVRVRHENRVGARFFITDDGPEFRGVFYPAKWTDERQPTENISEEELEQRKEEAIPELRAHVEDEYY